MLMKLLVDCVFCPKVVEVTIKPREVGYHRTPERLAIEAAKEKGWARRRIAERVVMLCPKCEAKEFPKKRGPKPRRGRPTSFSIAEARRLVADGNSLAAVGRLLGVSKQAVAARLAAPCRD